MKGTEEVIKMQRKNKYVNRQNDVRDKKEKNYKERREEIKKEKTFGKVQTCV